MAVESASTLNNVNDATIGHDSLHTTGNKQGNKKRDRDCVGRGSGILSTKFKGEST